LSVVCAPSHNHLTPLWIVPATRAEPSLSVGTSTHCFPFSILAPKAMVISPLAP
jgi:hypothetical protein